MEPTATTYLPADDGTRLALHLTGGPGDSDPLLCLPGGPMLDAGYLGNLGGLDAHRALALLDLRGTGGSATPADPTSYRCDRQVADLEAVRRRLGLARLSLCGHSAGANLVYAYAAAHPDRVERLLLVSPSTRGLGIEITDEARSDIARLRADEPWYAEASAALGRIQSGAADEADWIAISPFEHGRWDEETRAYDTWMEARRDDEKAAAYGAEGAFEPTLTRAALRDVDAPVLVLAGGCDVGNPPQVMAEVAAVFGRGRLEVQEHAGHYPWVDDPARFVDLVAGFVTPL